MDNNPAELENIYRIVFEHAPVGIYTLNTEGVIESFNPKMVEMAGAKNASEVLGMNALEMPSYKEVGLDEMFRKGLAGETFDTETRYISQTGKKETWRHYRGVPIKLPEGKVGRLLLLVEDITERKKLEQQLSEYAKKLEAEVQERTKKLENLKEEYRTVLDGSLVGITVLQEGVFKYVNKKFADIFGYSSPTDIIGRPWQCVVVPEDIEKVRDGGIEDRMQGKGAPKNYTYRGLRKDGGIIDIEVSSNPALFEGKPAAIASQEDITKRKNMEEQIEQHLEELERFQQITMNRELKMIELKKRIETLESQIGNVPAGTTPTTPPIDRPPSIQ
ncbi:MAG TPA: PAS domain S-box protein [Candidatus Paceibacterota bacterium]|nr:PAS domain S-box protein [Candidatus Paceibacterota bacterium]